MKSTAIACVGIGLVVATARPAFAVCENPNAMIVLDKSSSMVRSSIGGKTLWTIAKESVSAMLRDNSQRMNFGLMLFPTPNQCSPGSVVVPIGPGTRGTIENSLGDPPPYSGNYTPMAQTLDVAATVPELLSTAQRNSVVLITDGWQWCSDATASADRFKPVDAVKRLKQLNVSTFVVGFGAGVDVLTLNKMAKEGGTMRTATCNPAGTDRTATNNCYYQANNGAELTAALSQIGVIITNEICDGLDNNCDGRVDEDLSRPCTTPGMTGTETCSGGQWIGCRPAVEVCGNGVDDNGNGQIDEGCECAPGATEQCGTDVGVCEKGTRTCGADGKWGACTGGQQPAAETCDGRDEDCDGQLDNGAACPSEGGLPQLCGCGGCAPPCQNGECFNGGRCVQGYCIVDRCPAGMHCEGQTCVPGAAPPTPAATQDAGPAVTPPPALPPPPPPAEAPLVGPPDEGCACSLGGAATGAGMLPMALLGMALVARRLRRRG